MQLIVKLQVVWVAVETNGSHLDSDVPEQSIHEL